MSASPYRESDIQRVFGNTAAGTTDAEVLAALTGRRQRVLALSLQNGAAGATSVTINTKPSGSGVAISPTWNLAASGGHALPFNPHGWFETAPGEGLALTTGAGATVGWLLTVVVVGSPAGEGTSPMLMEDTQASGLLLEDGSALLLEAA